MPSLFATFGVAAAAVAVLSFGDDDDGCGNNGSSKCN